MRDTGGPADVADPRETTVVARVTATGGTLTLEIPIDAGVAALLRALPLRLAPHLVVVPGAGETPRPHATNGAPPVTLDHEAQTIERSGVTIPLTAKERDVLAMLLRAGGGVVRREELLRRIWGYSDQVRTRTLDTHISALRRKLARLPGPAPRILSVRNVGYRWQG